MSEQKKVSAIIISDFHDAGTGQRFAAGALETIEEGAFANYLAAGLVRKATAEEGKAARNGAAA
jgi:hypothetical protein